MYTQYKMTNEQFTGMEAELHSWDLLHEQAPLETTGKHKSSTPAPVQEDWQIDVLLSHQCFNSPIQQSHRVLKGIHIGFLWENYPFPPPGRTVEAVYHSVPSRKGVCVGRRNWTMTWTWKKRLWVLDSYVSGTHVIGKVSVSTYLFIRKGMEIIIHST